MLSAGVVEAWSALTRDANPLHTDAAYAAGTRFGGAIVQGHLLAALAINAAQREHAGDQLSVDCTFQAPVPVGSTVDILVKRTDGGDVSARLRCDGNDVVRVEIGVETTEARSEGIDESTDQNERAEHDD